MFLLTNVLLAQDPHFSQFYSNPQFLNPASAGLTEEHRLVANYRTQWPGIKSAYQTYMLAYDNSVDKINSGIGFYAMQDAAGVSGVRLNQFQLSYNYKIKINEDHQIRAGLSGSYNMKSLDQTKLIFNDQLITGAAVSLDAAAYQNITYFDLNAGVLYNSRNVWCGVVVKHLNTPNVSMIGKEDKLPMYIGVHGGVKKFIGETGPNDTEVKKYLSFAFNYRHQLNYDQLDLGAYFFIKPITFGVWYRGIPFKSYAAGYPNSESVTALLGFEIPKKNIRIGYSFDFTVSNLQLNRTAGAHEISLIYEFASIKRKEARATNKIALPKF